MEYLILHYFNLGPVQVYTFNIFFMSQDQYKFLVKKDLGMDAFYLFLFCFAPDLLIFMGKYLEKIRSALMVGFTLGLLSRHKSFACIPKHFALGFKSSCCRRRLQAVFILCKCLIVL